MRGFWTDRIAIVTALIGVGLMILTIVWRINPVEGSVVPRFLTGNPVGVAVIYVLVVTCMPVWILAVSLSMSVPLPEHGQYVLACGSMLIFQAVVYFMIGKLISICVRRFKKKKAIIEPADPGDA
jgi:hypothetical protein